MPNEEQEEPEMSDFQIYLYGFGIILYATIILAVFGALCYMSYLEYQDWKDTKQLIRDNNGTCIDKGYSVECSYSNSEKIINADSKCYRNDVLINCSDVGKW